MSPWSKLSTTGSPFGNRMTGGDTSIRPAGFSTAQWHASGRRLPRSAISASYSESSLGSVGLEGRIGDFLIRPLARSDQFPYSGPSAPLGDVDFVDASSIEAKIFCLSVAESLGYPCSSTSAGAI